VPLPKQTNPNITKKIKAFYIGYVLGGVTRKFNASEEAKFIKASNMVMEFWENNGKNMNYQCTTPMAAAEHLCMAIKESFGDRTSKVYPGTFCGNFALDRMLARLKDHGALSDDQDQVFGGPTDDYENILCDAGGY